MKKPIRTSPSTNVSVVKGSGLGRALEDPGPSLLYPGPGKVRPKVTLGSDKVGGGAVPSLLIANPEGCFI